MSLSSLENSVTESSTKLSEVKQEHDQIAHKVDLLKHGSVCPDLLEEEAKRVLGYVHENERVVIAN